MTMRGQGIGLLSALAAGCFTSNPGSGPAPTKGPPLVSFATVDLSTGTRAAEVKISDSGDAPEPRVADAVTSSVRVFSWPAGLDVSPTWTITTMRTWQEANGGVHPGYSLIRAELDPTLDGSGWYAIAVAPQAAEYRFESDQSLFAFSDGTRGVRFSPAHAPLVARVMACQKDGGVVAAYAHFSEPLNAAGALGLDYGATAVPCSVGSESPAEVQFICANASAGQPFVLRIAAGATAQASGAAMAATTLRSADLEKWSTNDGCSHYKPAIAN